MTQLKHILQSRIDYSTRTVYGLQNLDLIPSEDLGFAGQNVTHYRDPKEEDC